MKKIILLSLIVIGVLALGQVALADSAVLSVSPASASSTVGAPINISVQINPAANKVCVVKGTLNLSNLTCQSISLSVDPTKTFVVTNPTCANPSFNLGIYNCATTTQNILSLSVRGVQVGQASLSFTGIKVIGEGTDVAFTSQGGLYNITAAALPVPKPVQKPKQEVTAPAQQATSTTTVSNQTVSLGAAVLASMGNLNWYNWFLIIMHFLIFIYFIYFFIKKRKKQDQNKE